jgi:Chlorophyll A-B binding protein
VGHRSIEYESFTFLFLSGRGETGMCASLLQFCRNRNLPAPFFPNTNELYIFPIHLHTRAHSGTKFADIPNGYAALEAIPYAGKLQLFAFIGFLEVFVMRDFVGGDFPGDLRNNYFDLGWDTFDDATKARKRTIELNQGRAAMMGILALMVHEQLGVSLIPSGFTTDYSF